MSTSGSFGPITASEGKPVQLAMQRLWLSGQILPAGARLLVQHVFRSEEATPLEVIYSFPLPRDAALRRFRITGEDFESHSELMETTLAVQKYERAITDGSLAALARRYSDGLTNLTVGNIRPKETVTVELELICGVELSDDGLRFRFPFTLAPSYHSQAKVALIAPGEGEIELPASEFGDVILPPFRSRASSLHQVGFELSLIGQLAFEEIGSPSHALRIKQGGGRSAVVSLATGKAVPNCDLVLDARFQSVEPQVLAGRDANGKGRFAAIVPSTSFGGGNEAPRRIVILLDRSGSMAGTPIEQARKAIEACLAVLAETDLFGLVAFSNEPTTFQTSLVAGTRKMRDQAHDFLMKMNAGGGTGLVKGFEEAARLLGGQGGDILILTDGQVFGTETILAAARNANVRMHCLGIGDASQDRFLALLARETGGVSRFMTPQERIDLTAVDLFASISRPVASGLKADGHVQPAPPTLVFRGTPVLLFGQTEAADDQLVLTWNEGCLQLPIDFEGSDVATTVTLLQGSRLITDWESRYPSEQAMAPLEKRNQSRVATRLRDLSQTYGLASREVSLVAVVTRPGDRPGDLPKTRVVPLGIHSELNSVANFGFAGFFGHADPLMMPTSIIGSASAPAPARPSARPASFLRRLFKERQTKPAPVDDVLLNIASRLEADGGMPGRDSEARAIASVVALLALLSERHTSTSGTFRLHVTRLLAFLKSLTGLSKPHQQIVDSVIQLARDGAAPAGEWVRLAQTRGDHWAEVERAVLVSRT